MLVFKYGLYLPIKIIDKAGLSKIKQVYYSIIYIAINVICRKAI